MLNVFLISLGGFAGAVSRFHVQKRFLQAGMSSFPYATLIVNLLGSLLIGVLVGIGVQAHAYLLAVTGFLGAFTTFSTVNVDIIKMYQSKRAKIALLYLGLTYCFGILLVFTGICIGRAIQ
ncbi:fluoride efflux transporter FluC [Bacillus sp. T33-2]|uniref:fluoride efflux transporter FluC n=1 Tax=Bacillus sp. T33-2 TaxID=2054168 RepID=UPI000C7898EE|nr:CrcB family protein [Bacillus sp. T33-2]PLR98798.1 fluoride efflux transporter CrcB [Bacillus sp. T33-2]